MENPGLTATLKAGKDFDAPWVVLHAANPQQLDQQLGALTPELLQKVTATAQHLIAANNLAAGGVGAGAPTPQAQPATTQQQAPVETREPQGGGQTCVHGQRVRRTGTSKRGPWVGWFCPTPKGTPGQCSAEFE